MAFTSYSDFLAKMSAGQNNQGFFQKVSANGGALAAGRWCEWYTATGIPAAGPLTGAAGTGTQIKQSVQGTGINIGANVSPALRGLSALQAFSVTPTVVPALAILCDFLVYYPSMVVTGGATTCAGVALPRYTNGVGVQAMVAVQTTLGGTQPTVTLTCHYSGGASPGAGGVLTSPVTTSPTTVLFQAGGHPFMPLPANATGITTIDSYTLGTGTTGTVAFFLVKPLAMIPIISVSVASERDCLVQLPSLPPIVDDAHLGWILCPGGNMVTTSTLAGIVNNVWG
jgi:hypothetical protein